MKNNLIIFLIIPFLCVKPVKADEEFSPFRFSAQVAMNIPLGDFGANWSTGFGVAGSFYYQLIDEISIGISSGWLFWEPPYELAPGYSDTFSSIPVQVNVNYYFVGNEYLPYAGFEYGYHFIDRTISDPLVKDVSEADEQGAAILFGILYPIGESLDVNANAKYSLIFTDPSSTVYFGLNAGITVYL